MSIKRKIGVIAIAASMLIGTGATVAQAGIDSVGCVTRAEFKAVRNGMSPARVAAIYDTPGTLAIRSGSFMIRDYKTCTAYHVTNVSFQSKRLSAKLYI